MKVFTYNIHKGRRPLTNTRVVDKVRDAIALEDPDVVFLQEVVAKGDHPPRAWDRLPWRVQHHDQHEVLAGDSWSHVGYARARRYRSGVMGNAILSKFPILREETVNLTAIPFEPRSLLYCEIELPGRDHRLHCFCVHLSLFQRGREKQYQMIIDEVGKRVPEDEPMIIAGDFNDFFSRACDAMGRPLSMRDVHVISSNGKRGTSFPSRFPLLALDRIYVRGMGVETVEIHGGGHWAGLSDHAPMSARLSMPPIALPCTKSA